VVIIEIEITQRTIQQGLAKVLTGQQPIPMNVVGFPVSQEAIELQQKVQQGLLKSLSEDGAIRVSVDKRKDET
jgi:hypothetical protein